jgi:hypothetical protein
MVCCNITSCQCKNANKKPNDISDITSNEDFPSHDDITMEISKHILLAEDKSLTLTFITANKETDLENYTLKISLEEKPANQNTKSKIGWEDTQSLEMGINKSLTELINPIKFLTQVDNTRTWQLTLNLAPALDSHEVTIQVELVNNKTATVIKRSQATWKNIKLRLKDITYNPIAKLVKCIIEKEGIAPLEALTLKYQNISGNEAIFEETNNQKITFDTQSQIQKEIDLQLDFKDAIFAEFNFELIEENCLLATKSIKLKNIQIGIEAPDNFKGNKPLTCFIENKGLYKVNSEELGISIKSSPDVTFTIRDTTGTSIKNTPCEVLLSDIVGKKELVKNEKIPIVIQLAKTTAATTAAIRLEIRDIEERYTHPWNTYKLTWDLGEDTPTPPNNSQPRPNPRNPDNSVNTEPRHPSNDIPATPINQKIPDIPTTDTSLPTNNFILKKEDPNNTNPSKKPKESESAPFFPKADYKINSIHPNSVPTTDIPAESSRPNGNKADEAKNALDTDITNQQKAILDKISNLAEELQLAHISDKVTLINLIDSLAESLQALEEHITTIPAKVINAYEEASKAYAITNVALMDTEVDDLCVKVATKLQNNAEKAQITVHLTKDKSAAYTTTANIYCYAAMSYMACCQKTDHILYADTSLVLADKAADNAFKAHTSASYSYVTKAYYYATMANKRIFNLLKDPENVKNIAKKARNAANRARYNAELSNQDQAYVDATLAYAEVTEIYSVLATKMPKDTKAAKEAIQIALQTAQAAKMMAEKTTEDLAKSAAKEALKIANQLE